MLTDERLAELRALPGGKPRILALADLIESLPHARRKGGFHMNYFRHTCGTPSCIMGWAYFIWGASDRMPFGAESDGMRCLLDRRDLTEEERQAAWRIALAPECPNLNFITPTQAAACLRHYAETGVVDWSLASRSA